MTYCDNDQIEVATFEKVKPGNSISGDAHTIIHTNDYTVCAVVDGLGSGEGARNSAVTVIEAIQSYHTQDVVQIIEACNQSMLKKRGAVATILKIDYEKKKIYYSNMGNVRFIMYSPDGTTVRPIPSRGYLSGKRQKMKSGCFRYDHGSLFLLYSDGVVTPPSKITLMNKDSLKNLADEWVQECSDTVDDVTLLIGKLK